jgi:hypothetical protein
MEIIYHRLYKVDIATQEVTFSSQIRFTTARGIVLCTHFIALLREF